MLVTFANGVVVSYRGSWVSSDEPTYWAGDWRMECESGLIRGRAARGARTARMATRSRCGRVTAR